MSNITQSIQLSLHKDYCPDWTPVTSIRELIANAIDTREEWTLERNPDEGQLIIHSKGRIPLSALLMGGSQKDADSIGRFGEGLKVAALALLRSECMFIIEQHVNGVAFETWTFSMEHSELFSQPVLTVQRCINDAMHPDDIPDSVHCYINCPSATVYEHIFYGLETLLMNEDEHEEQTVFECNLFTMSKQAKPSIYVSGLHIKDFHNFHFAYNFRPDAIVLNRDRNHLDPSIVSYTICNQLENALSQPLSRWRVSSALLDMIYNLLEADGDSMSGDFDQLKWDASSYPGLMEAMARRAQEKAGGKAFSDSKTANSDGYILSSALSSVIRGGYSGRANGRLFEKPKQEAWWTELSTLVEASHSKIRRDVRKPFEDFLAKHEKKNG